MNVLDLASVENADGDVLRHRRFAARAIVVKGELVVFVERGGGVREFISLRGSSSSAPGAETGGIGGITGADRGTWDEWRRGEDGEGKQRLAFLFREADGGGGGGLGGAQGVQEGSDGDFEVDRVGWASGLDGVGFEEGFLRWELEGAGVMDAWGLLGTDEHEDTGKSVS